VPAALVRAATLDDAEAIRSIYNLEVETSTATMDLVPRSAEAQRAWLADRSGAFATVVAVAGTDVLGYAALSPYKDRPGYRTTVEDSVYVRRDWQGQGLGTRLLESILGVATANGFHSVIARVEASQGASRALHERCGFTLVGVEREVGRKFNRWLDVAVLQCLLHERLASRR
jgi:L-amino acid N-acyltransferase